MTIHTTNDDDVPAAPKKTLRPRNRKAQILAIARRQFAQRSYHGVSMEDIASEAGITAGALYRHFPNKQELLAQSMLSTSATLIGVLDAADPHDSAQVCLALTRYGLDNDIQGILFDQEARNLTPERRAEVRVGLQAVVAKIAGALAAQRPDLPEADGEPLSWAMASLAMSPGRHRTPLPRKRFEALLVRMFDAVRSTPTATLETPAPVAVRAPGFSHVSRREALISAAISLFHKRGYQSVTMEEIGAAADMASSSIYTYFDSKAEVLQAILSRGNESLRLGLAQALSEADSRADALNRVARSYIHGVLMPESPIGILIEDSLSMPEEARSLSRRAQREYVDEWVHLMGPDTPEARATVLATIGMINDLARMRARTSPRMIEELARRVLAVSAA